MQKSSKTKDEAIEKKNNAVPMKKGGCGARKNAKLYIKVFFL
jgi:hypothetical protein